METRSHLLSSSGNGACYGQRSPRFVAALRRGAWLGVLAAAVGVACGGDSAPGDVTAFCKEKATRECNKLKTACAFVTTTQCEAARQSACATQAQALQVGTHVYRSSNAEACLSAIDKTYAGMVPAATWQQTAATCEKVFSGNLPTNSVCASDLDCGGSLTCDSAKKICADRKSVASGAGCSNPGETCPADQYCGMQTTFYVCQARPGRGAACSDAVPCGQADRCVAGVCAARVGENMPCTADAECATGFCEPYNRICRTFIGFDVNSNTCQAFEGAGVVRADAAPVTSAADAGVPVSSTDGP